MIRKFTLIMLFLFTLGIGSFSQNASVTSANASPGESTNVFLKLESFTNIGSVNFNIQFDASVLTYTGFDLEAGVPGGFTALATGNILSIVGTWPTNTYPTGTNFNGNVLKLKFVYNGMTTCNLNFLGTCEVVKYISGAPTVIFPTYSSGSVSMNTSVTAKARLIAKPASTGGEADVKLEFSGFLTYPNAGSVTQVVHYDPSKLTFANAMGFGGFSTGMNCNANTSTGIITITWFKPGASAGTGIPLTLADSIKLKFIYIGSTQANVDFYPGCIISNTSGTNMLVDYVGGSVSLLPTLLTAVLNPVNAALQGSDYNVPLTFANFPTVDEGGTAAFTVSLNYDNQKLTYLGLLAPVAGLIVSSNPLTGVITLVWTTPDPIAPDPDLDGIFLTLKFKYKGVGVANVNFGDNCVFSTNTGGSIGNLQVVYTGSVFTPAVVAEKAIIGFVSGTGASPVIVPVYFTGGSLATTKISAVTLHIAFDSEKLTFIDVPFNPYGVNYGYNQTTKIITIIWTSVDGEYLDRTVSLKDFIGLRFNYNSGSGAPSAAVSFTGECEITKSSPVEILPLSFVNGGVNYYFTVSGTLNYDSEPQPLIPLDGFTVEIRTEPGGILVGSCVTSVIGYYEFSVPNGTYKLSVLQPSDIDHPWYSDLDNALALYDYSLVVPTLPYENALRLLAGDVNMVGGIDLDDAIILLNRILFASDPDYTSPNWVFENPTVNVNNADVSLNFMGLSSGDVLGTNTNP